MAKTVEIPDEAYAQLEQRARAAGLSIPELVARELGMMVPKRPLDEIIAEVFSEPRVHMGSSTANIIRELRGPRPDTDVDHH